MQCPVCAVESPADDRFCEECGAELGAVATAAVRCGCGALASEVDEDGFCLRCGKKARVALASDRIEVVLSAGCAGVSDRGLRHDRNEDRFGIVAEAGGYGCVVCDGVSATRWSEIASEAVVAGVVEALGAALRSAQVLNSRLETQVSDARLETQVSEARPGAPGSGADSEVVMRGAVAAGSLRLAARMNLDTRRSSASRKLRARDEAGVDAQAPSTTVVAALVVGGRLTVGWLGDSRAYWIDAHGARALTEDHSWMNQVVRDGVMSAEEAAKSPKAHAITRWMGADASDDEVPEVRTETLSGAGTLLLCTDGLWNYAADAAAIAELVSRAEDKEAVELARELVAFALERGGVDNVTVAVLRVGAELDGASPRTLNAEGNQELGYGGKL